MKICHCFFVFLTFFSLTSTMASSPGGSDSCGLGWNVTEKKSFSATSTRGTTNSFVPPTLGMTSGTIGCDQHSIVQKDIQTIRYITTYFDLLKHEMSKGSGDYLKGLAQLMEYSGNQCFAEVLHKHYSQIIPGRTPLEAFKGIQKVTAKECPMVI